MVDPELPPNPNDEKDDLVFPPIEHENLEIAASPCSPPPPQQLQLPIDSRLRGWISISLQILRSKLSSLRQRGSIWSFGVPTAIILMSCWFIFAIRKKRTTLTLNETRFSNIIRDKDRKIAQLLHQIAQMNEILIDRHKALAAKAVK